jgi:hypothetical protein
MRHHGRAIEKFATWDLVNRVVELLARAAR